MAGYHNLILKDGTVQGGRPEDMVGAHVRGHNQGSLGIALQGHGDKEEWTEEQWLATTVLCNSLIFEHNLRVEDVRGHRDFTDAKTCSGELVDMD